MLDANRAWSHTVALHLPLIAREARMAAGDFDRAGAGLLRVIHCTGGHHVDQSLQCVDDVGRCQILKPCLG